MRRDWWVRRGLSELSRGRSRERRKLGTWRGLEEGAAVVTYAGPRPRPREARGEGVGQRGRLGVPMRHLLADCSGIQRRSSVRAVGIVRGVLGSQRAWMGGVGRGRVGIGLGPRLGHGGSIDHRAIHESGCCEGGSALEENRP